MTPPRASWRMSLPYLRYLRICSVVFLSIPWLVFIGTWLRPGWAIALFVLHAYLVVRYASSTDTSPAGGEAERDSGAGDGISPWSLLGIVLVAVVWVSLSGSGGVGFQNLPDWDNKNVLMSDLIRYPWPVTYGDNLTLNYYLALYLPSSALGKIAGWNAAQWSLYAYVLAGAMLALLWVFSFAGKVGLPATLLFVVFGGLDIVGYLLAKHRLPAVGTAIEWWTTELQFSGNTTLMFWVPQHCLPGWILTCLMLDDAKRMRRVTYVGLFIGLCALWSPFVTIGLIPVGIAAYFVAGRPRVTSTANLVYLPAVAALSFAFYSPHAAGGELDAGVGFWAAHFSPSGIVTMCAFLALEVGVYGLLIAASWKSLERDWRAIAIVVAVSSVVWVLVPETVGHGGFTMRSSIPTLLLLFLLVLRTLSTETRRPLKVVLVACLALGAVSSFQEASRAVLRRPLSIPAPRPTSGVLELSKRHRNEFVMPTDSRAYRLVFRVK